LSVSLAGTAFEVVGAVEPLNVYAVLALLSGRKLMPVVSLVKVLSSPRRWCG